MNRREVLRSAAALPALGVALSAAAEQRKELKITGVETDLLKPPPGKPIYDALQRLNVDKGAVVLRMASGMIGTSFHSC